MFLELIKNLPVEQPIKLKDLGIIRVPQVVYQILFDCIDRHRSLYHNQEKIKKILFEWLKETYPDKELESFIDLDNEQAAVLRNQIPEITFGMYIKLLNKKQDEKSNHLLTSSSGNNELHEEQLLQLEHTTPRLLQGHDSDLHGKSTT